MAKKMTAGERIVIRMNLNKGMPAILEGMRTPQTHYDRLYQHHAAMIDRAIDRAYQRGRKSVLVLASTLSGVKDQKLPKTWGKIVTKKKRRPSNS